MKFLDASRFVRVYASHVSLSKPIAKGPRTGKQRKLKQQLPNLKLTKPKLYTPRTKLYISAKASLRTFSCHKPLDLSLWHMNPCGSSLFRSLKKEYRIFLLFPIPHFSHVSCSQSLVMSLSNGLHSCKAALV